MSFFVLSALIENVASAWVLEVLYVCIIIIIIVILPTAGPMCPRTSVCVLGFVRFSSVRLGEGLC